MAGEVVLTTIKEKRLRMRIWERAGGMCENIVDGKRCFKSGAEIHHLTPKGMGGRRGAAKVLSESEDNKQLWCLDCHRARH